MNRADRVGGNARTPSDSRSPYWVNDGSRPALRPSTRAWSAEPSDRAQEAGNRQRHLRRKRTHRRRRCPRRRRLQLRRDRSARRGTARCRHRGTDRRRTRRRIARVGRAHPSRQQCAIPGTDRKWTELSNILHDEALTTDPNGWPRKLIIFTEHRDTLDYLAGRIRSLLGGNPAVQAIHGGARRRERRQITEEFTKNRGCQILLATGRCRRGDSTCRPHT